MGNAENQGSRGGRHGVAALVAVPGTAAADESDPYSGSFLVSRSTVERQAAFLSDNNGGVSLVTGATGVSSLYCGPAAAGCLGAAAAGQAFWQSQQSFFNRAKRERACVVFLYLPGLGAPTSGALAGSSDAPYSVSTYNGAECRDNEDRPLTPELLNRVS